MAIDKVRADRQSWARDVLGIHATDAPAGVAKQHFLKMLAETDFVPTVAAQQAFEFLITGREPESDTDIWKTVREQSIQEEIEMFAVHFFNLPVAQRRERWERLSTQCSEFPRCRARLEALKVGLDCSAGSVPSEDARLHQLGCIIAELFVLPAGERGRKRHGFIEATAAEPREWARCARRFRRGFPNVAVLDPGLLAALGAGVRLQRLHEKRKQARSMTPKGLPVDLLKIRHPALAVAIVLLLSIVVGGVLVFSVPREAPKPFVPSNQAQEKWMEELRQTLHKRQPDHREHREPRQAER
jgi:hypothetical protein